MLSDLMRDRMPAGPLHCDDVADLLPGLVDGSARLDRADRRHVETCLRCQAELAQYRKLLRAMRAMQTHHAEPPIGLAHDVLRHVHDAGARRTSRGPITGRRAAYIGGIAAAATAAGAGAAIVLVSRGRKGRLPLAG